MPVVRMPNGDEVNFPDDMPKEQIRSLIASKFPELEKPSFTGGVKSDLEKRVQNTMQSMQAGMDKQQTPIETGLQMAGQAGGFVSDVVGQGLGAGFRQLPQGIQEGTKNVFTAVANSPVGNLVGSAVQKYGEFEQNNPRAARNIGALANIGAYVGSGLPAAQTGKVATSATMGAAKGIGKPIKAAAKMTLPAADEGLLDTALLATKKYNIPLSADQITGSTALKNIQKVSQELPFSGQAAFKDKQRMAWQRGIFNTIGVDADKFTPKNMSMAFSKVGDEFDTLTKGKEFNIGEDFVNNIVTSKEEIASQLGSDAADIFEKEALKVINDFSQGDVISGDLISRQRARINALARGAKGERKDALLQLEGLLVDGITSQDPALQQALSTAKQRYKNLIVVEPLARKAKGGFISPSQLNSRVSQVYKRAHTVGESGDIGELARIGYELLPELGGSDTLQKATYLGVGASGYASIPTTAGVLTGNRLYQSAINRNQGLVNAILEKAAAGQKVTTKEIMQLPPKDAKTLLNMPEIKAVMSNKEALKKALSGSGERGSIGPIDTKKITVNPTSVNDSYGGELFGYKQLDYNGVPVSAADINVIPSLKEVSIQNIVTKNEYKRKGFATRLIKEIQKEYPNYKISVTSTTEDGSKLFNTIPFDENGFLLNNGAK